MELAGVAGSIEDFCERVRGGLAEATFDQRRKLVKLLIDRVIVTEEKVEIRYVIPTDPSSEQVRFCHLRSDYLHYPSLGQEWPGAFFGHELLRVDGNPFFVELPHPSNHHLLRSRLLGVPDDLGAPSQESSAPSQRPCSPGRCREASSHRCERRVREPILAGSSKSLMPSRSVTFARWTLT
jgi:hypothetical protein